MTITPRFVDLNESLSRRYLEREKLADLDHLSEQVVGDMGNVADMEVESERRAGVEGAEVYALSTNSYNTVSSAGDDIVSYGRFKELDLRNVGEPMKLQAKESSQSWRKKYSVGSGVVIYHGVDLAEHPYLNHTVIFYKGFLKAGIRLELSSLATSFFNYIDRAPQQLTTTSFVALAIFYCLNAHPPSGNGELGLEQFFYYYQVARSSGTNKAKGKGLPQKGKKSKSSRGPLGFRFLQKMAD